MSSARKALGLVVVMAAVLLFLDGRVAAPRAVRPLPVREVFADDPTATFTPGPTSTRAPTNDPPLPTAPYWYPPSDDDLTATWSPPTMVTPHVTPFPSSTP